MRWVEDDATRIPAFRGALWHGSILTLPDDAELAASSDIDIVLVIDDPGGAPKLGKIDRDGVLLDVSFIAWEEIRSPEVVLADHSLAPTLRNPQILADPTGSVAQVQRQVGARFADRQWVERRCEAARGRIILYLGSLAPSRPFPENVTSWLFGTGVTTHVLLVASLRNPTVRKRYLAVRDLLAQHDRLDIYEWLLSLLGCRDMTPDQASTHLDALGAAYDAAAEAMRSPFPFAGDIGPRTRPIAIGGSRELIDAGDHREAVFWIAATWARVMTVFHHDAPELTARYDPAFRAMLADLGVVSFDDLQRRAAEVVNSLPRLMSVAAAIMDATPEIDG